MSGGPANDGAANPALANPAAADAAVGGARREDAPFVADIRSRPGIVRLGNAGEPVATIRVQLEEAWDTLRFEVPLTEPALSLKVRALALLAPHADMHEEYVMKLRGFEVLDEHASLADSGATNGSIFLLTHRRRRPVR